MAYYGRWVKTRGKNFFDIAEMFEAVRVCGEEPRDMFP